MIRTNLREKSFWSLVEVRELEPELQGKNHVFIEFTNTETYRNDVDLTVFRVFASRGANVAITGRRIDCLLKVQAECAKLSPGNLKVSKLYE